LIFYENSCSLCVALLWEDFPYWILHNSYIDERKYQKFSPLKEGRDKFFQENHKF
jgi:hypothetical protein